MVGLRVVINISVLLALVLVVVGHKNKRLHTRQDGQQTLCTNNPAWFGLFPPCSTTSTSAPITATTSTSTDSSAETSSESDSTTPATNLQRAHWCRFPNNTYLPYGYSFMNTACSICQCTPSRLIRCQALQCMPTYCVDNSMPIRQSDQCCTQCAYEQTANACEYNGLSFPHGTIIKAVENQMECWCQLGNIECRNYMTSVFQNLDAFAAGSAVYIIMIILIVVLTFGFLLCCSCTVGCYYYFKRHQQVFQEAYDQYTNPTGWEPIDETEENVVDPTAEEKQLEAEKSQFENANVGFVPPPYAAYENAYATEQQRK